MRYDSGAGVFQVVAVRWIDCPYKLSNKKRKEKRYGVKLISVNDKLPPMSDRYWVNGRFHPYLNKIIKACVFYSNGFWHVGKGNEVLEWVELIPMPRVIEGL